MSNTDDPWADDFPVEADEETLRVLREKMWDLDTKQLNELAGSLGVNAPDDRPGWVMTPAYDPQGNPCGPFWTSPDEPEA